MADSAGEKTEDPTPRKLREARKDGNVAKSQDFTAAAVLLGSMLVLMLFGGQIGRVLMQTMRLTLGGDGSLNPTRADDVAQLSGLGLRAFAEALVPLLLCVVVVAVIANVLQVGLMASGKTLQPKLSKLNPIKGAANLVNKKAAMRLVMSLSKLILIAVVAVLLVRKDLAMVLHTGLLTPGEALAFGSWRVATLGVELAVLMMVLALLDFWYQKVQRMSDLKMSKQEVKEEMKNMDGDPAMKQRRAAVARQLAMQRVSAAVPGADVVVNNPTHFSVALRYEEGMPAPKVVAKGADLVAQRIRELAKRHGVPQVEMKPLARALYREVEVGQFVPPEHYAAAAEVLAFVYGLVPAAAPRNDKVQMANDK